MIVYDPTGYQIHFMVIPPPREGKKLHALLGFLNDVATKFAQDVKRDAPVRVAQLDYLEQASDQLTAVQETEIAPGHWRSLDLRSMHDSVMLRTIVLHKEKKGFETAELKDLDFSAPLPQPPDGVPSYLGALRIRYVEIDANEKAIQAVVGKAVADAIDWTWFARAEPLVTAVGTMLLGFPPRTPHQGSTAPALDMVFVGPRREEAGIDAAKRDRDYPLHPFLLMLPELALCHLKVRNCAEKLRDSLLGRLADRERELGDLLPQRGERRPTMLQMLDRNDDITTRQAELTEAVAQVQAELRTMHINRDNFIAAATRPFHRIADKLLHLLIDRWLRGTESQAENDLGYIQGTLQLAGSHFQSIDASAEADMARYLRRINWWIMLLTVFQALIGIVSVILAWKALLASAP